MKGKKQALQYNFPSYICIIPRVPILPIRIPIPTASYFDWLLQLCFVYLVYCQKIDKNFKKSSQLIHQFFMC